MTKRSLLLSLAILALPATASANYYEIINGMYHQCGTPNGAWWRAEYCGGSYTTYGPYAKSLSPGDNLAVIAFKARAWGPSQPLKWTVDVHDWVSNKVLVEKTYSQPILPSDLAANWEPIIPFSVAPNHDIQVRTKYEGVGELDQCGVHILTEATNKVVDLGGASGHQHQIGEAMLPAGSERWRVYASMPACQASSCAHKFLSYGPYGPLPAKDSARFALFNLGWEAIGGEAVGADETVAVIDVMAFNGAYHTVLASRSLARKEFTSGFAASTLFPLKFKTTSAQSQFQYRVRWSGKGVLYHFRTKVYDPDTNACLF